jgi:glycosyltransferase involved in cell wall biosynthesis
MKILYVSSYYKPAYIYGGTVRCVSQLCESMVKLKSQVTVLTTNVNGTDLLRVPLNKAVNVDGVDVFYCPIVRIPPYSYYYAPSLAKACRQKIRDFDVVVLQSLFSYGMQAATRACKQAGIPYIIQPHGQLLPWSLRQKWLKKQIFLTVVGRNYLNGAASLHCTAPSEAEAINKLGIRSPKFVIPNGIDSGHFADLPVRGMIRQRFQIPAEARLLLFLGRLHPKKRPDLAVEALSAAQSLPGETHLILAGPDEMQMIPKLKAQAQNFACANHLHFAGLLEGDEILSALADADLFLMPSEPESENFGMSALEAMAAGLPVLVSEGVPVGHWVELAGAGRMIPCTADSYRRVVCELLAQPRQLKEMGKRGRELACQNFEITSVAQQMLSQYKSIVETGRPLQSNSNESYQERRE